MLPGRLTERVRFDREVRLPDGGGGYELGWEPVFTKWAQVEPLKGREALEAMKLEASSLYKVTLRSDYDVNPAWRLVWVTGGNLVMNVREAQPVTSRAMVRVLIAQAGVDEVRAS